jgi:AbrB family looped-hinge helix DNA binding protein
MSKITGKFQVTLPKRLADTYGIQVGDDVEFLPAGDRIVLVPARRSRASGTPRERLRYFDRATDRQCKREGARELNSAGDRGWTREELYTHGRPR